MTEYTDHYAPEGLRTRGTLLVVPGRGETRAAYTRLGSRLAADAYRVRVVDAPVLDEQDLAGALLRFGALLAAAVEDSATGEEGVARPLVLVGADSGAAVVAALLGRDGVPPAARPDAVVLAGMPGLGAATDVAGWEDELGVRTACPAHRGALTEDAGIRRGALGRAVPEALLSSAYGSEVGVPVLLLAGDTDPLADHEALARTAKSLPKARLSVVRGAHHDVLNDTQHRSVAAELVTFLETVRNELVPVVTVEASTW
ncbi:alpha/beta hydrolase [Streptomyces sp. NPDC002793]|uniref:alpha/beta hydrolase n=1 Tax=Streptomyces sp. NPDC002793 TaxID=3154432 RepID=UPI00332563B4